MKRKNCENTGRRKGLLERKEGEQRKDERKDWGPVAKQKDQRQAKIKENKKAEKSNRTGKNFGKERKEQSRKRGKRAIFYGKDQR
jgi:hypothetical protein